MINKNIWGCICECGEEVFDYFDDHPWSNDKSILKTIKCNKCGRLCKIDCKIAGQFYNDKIFQCFKEVSGSVLEIGCGGGLISEYVASLETVTSLVTVDIDQDSMSIIANKHYQMDLNNFDEDNFREKFDYVICRDVLMYLDDIEYTFSKLSKISNKVILLNWYDKNHKNCLNKTPPLKILDILNKYYKNLVIEYPYFYKNGYLIKSLS